MKKMFRKALAILLCIVMVFCSAPLAGFVGVELPSFGEIFGIKAEAATSGTCGENLTWSFDESTGTLTISGEGSMTDFESSDYVPWYDYCLLIKKVIISDGVTSIGGYAFIWCENLTSIKIPDGVMSIGEAAFYNCCTLTSITIPDSVTSIGNYVFAFCESLTSIKIPDGVTSIGESAFEECTSLTSITLPDNVTSIGKYAFCGCPFTEIAIPDSVTSIDKIAFYDCTYLTDVYYAGNEEEWNSITIGSDNECLTEAAIHYDYQQLTWIVDNEETVVVVKAGEAITVPDNPVKEGYTFAGWVPEVPEVMPDYDLDFTAVWEEIKVTSSSCGENLTWNFEESTGTLTISGEGDMYDWNGYSDMPWYNYESLIKTVIISDGVTSIGESAFEECTSLTSITIPDSVTSIGKYAFCGCSFARIAIPDSVTSIDEYAFYDCTDLTSVYYAGKEEEWNVISFGSGNDCLLNSSIYFASGFCGENLTWTFYEGIGELLIDGTGEMTDWTSAEAVPWHAIRSDIIYVNLGYRVASVGNYAFYGCKNLKVAALSNITSIGEWSFSDCDSITGIILPETLETIEYAAFSYCDSLNTLSIPASVSDIGRCVWAYCPAMEKITVDENNQYYSNDECGVLYNKDKTVLIRYPAGNKRTVYKIRDSVTNVKSFSFDSCKYLETVVIGDGIETTENYVFYHSPGLKNIIIGKNMKGIEYDAFAGCSGLTEVVLPDNIKYIDVGAFGECTNLEFLHIPASVVSNGSNILVNTSAYICSTTEDCYAKSYAEEYGYEFRVCSGHDPEKNNIISGTCGDNFTWTIDETTDVLTISGEGEMNTWRDNEESPWISFKPDLKSVVIEKGVTSISEKAFEGCDKLETIVLPDTVTVLDTSAFGSCYGVTDIYFGGTEEDWNSITIGSSNEHLTEATIHYGKYMTSWNVDGETTVVAVKVGDTIIAPADPVKEGYTFAGWTPEIPEVMPEYDLEFTATWKESQKGDGTAENPYQITDKYELDAVRNNLNAHYVLMNDIEFSEADFAEGGEFYNDGKGFEPIGSYSARFAGVFDGNGFSIIDIRIENVSQASVFGYISTEGIVRNLGIENGTFNAKASATTYGNGTETLAPSAYAAAIAYINSGLIEECYSKSSIKAVANANAGTQMHACQSTAYAAGIAVVNNGTVRNCYNNSSVDSTATAYVWYTVSAVADTYACGIAATSNGTNSVIENCYSTTEGTTYAVTGRLDYSLEYPEGVKEPIVGKNSGTFENCYYLNSISDVSYGAALSDEQMKAKESFIGFDFNEIWFITSNGDYPYPQLRANPYTELVPSTSVSFESESIELEIGETVTPEVTVEPSDTTDNVTFTSSDESIVIVSESGEIIAVGVGTATITATTTSGITATCEITVAQISYQLIWNVDGETTVVSVKAGDAIVVPADPVKEGYTFAGWTPEVPEVMPENDVEFTAVWKKNCTVKFSFTNGEPDDTILLPCEVSIAEGDVLVLPSYPEHSNYLFDGWYDENGIRYPEGFEYYVKKDTTLYCNWIVLNSTVSFYGYEALAESPYMSADPSVVLGSANYHFGETIAFPAESSFPANAQIDGEYYTFVGWSKTVGGTVLTDAELYTQTMPAEDTAYYAVYERVKVMLIPNDDAEYWVANDKTCTTVIDRDGGTVDDYNEDDSAWYVFGLKDKITVNSTIDNSHLSTYIDVSGDGYYEVVDFKVKEGVVGTGAVINVYDNITDELVESFSIIIYGDVNGDGAITNIDHAIVLAEAEGTINKSDESSDDYDPCFVKAADMNGNGIIDYFDAAVFKNYVIAYLDIDQTTGKWFDSREYSLFFYTDETLKVSHDVKSYSGDETIVLPEVPTKDGYNFVGWFDYETNEPLALKMPEKTVFAYAVWEESLEHTVTYYVDGEVYETYSALFGEEVTIPADPVKEGYTFAGWTPEVPDVMPESDVEFTAIWTANKYKVKWNIDGTSFSQNIAYGSEIPVPDDPEKDGFEFAGWNPEIPATMPAEDITFTAMWNAKGYIITWVVDGVETQTSVPYGETITVPENPTKEGHTFVEWVPEIPETMPANDLTFTANFTVNSYYVTWIVDGAATVSNVQYGQPIVPPENPVKDGFKFTGWTPAIPASMPSYDMAFVAVWETDYTIDFSFDSVDIENGGTTQLEVIVSPEPTETPEIAWSSSDESVATVDENGLVTAISCGSAVITAELDEKTAFVTVNVAHSYTSETTEATCTQNGFTTYTCSVCGDVYTDNVTEAKGHAYTETVVASSCTGTGYTKYECSVCGDTYTDNETPAAGHSYDAIPIKPTCTSGGYTINMCSVCGQAYKSDAVDALGHNYNEKVVEATCVTGGYTEHTCLNCGDSYQDNIVESGEHNYVVTNVVVATCTDDGYTEFTCSYCDDSYQGNKIDATGHTITSVTNAATCTNGGYTLNVCNVCNNYTSITNQTEALGHEYITEVVTATCESGGYSRHTCTRGDHVYTSDETPALGHNYEATEIKATCIQNGCILNICLNCGRVNKSGATSAYGHSFSDWITVTEAGDNIEGLQTRTCKNCGYTEEKILPMLQRTTYTATFVADGNVVSYVEFLKGATSLVEPEVPQKHRYSGEWEEYTLTDSDITVNAEYTLIDLDDLSGIDFNKNASYNSATGEATISLYAASEAKTMISQTSKKVPLDIVLVVDQSGSMAEKLGGRVSKQEALIESANDFVNSVYADASANGVDHRIAVVGFGMGNKANGYEYPAYFNTEILTTGGNPVNMKDAKSSDYASALMSVNANGAMNANIVNAINSIDAKGATAADYGLSMACNVFANNADADGRQRIVVFMTDGEPTYSSEFSNSVATAAIQQAYQLKNTYDASVYSVGIFNSANGQLTKFMNYVSSNCDDAKSVSGNFDIDTDKFFVTVDNTDALSAVFTEIVVENITRTTDFDNITLIDTVSKYFTLTSQQEKALRISAIEKFGIKNSDIMVTRNADGTTTIEIKSIHPEEIGDKFVVSLDFAVSANENASVAGNYATNTEDAGIIVGDAENYECIFTAPTVNIPTDRNTVVFNVNGEIYAIKSVVSNGAITAPETDFIGDYKFTGWNIPAGTVANQPVAEFDATLVNQECVVIWNTDAGTETIIYAPGDVIDVPDVAPNSNGDSFRRWNGELPVTMPAESIEFTAVYGDHEHKYESEIIKAVTCLEDGKTKYTCSVCDDTYTETVECAGEHTWKAITGPANKYGHTPEIFKCDVCGISDDKSLEYILLEEEEGNIRQEFNYVDENGNKCQPDGDLTITVPLDEYVDADHVNVYRVNDDGTRTQCDSRFEDGVVEFDTNHFSTYIFEPIFQCMIEGNHPDSNSDGSCDVCRKWLGITVTWVVDGKETESRALTGTELVQPETPVKEGYTFIGWTPAVPETSPEYDVTYTAVFEVNSYTVKWIVDGVETVETYEFDSSITVPVKPAMDGYFFAGWTPAVPEKMPAKDMTFTAKFADYDVSKIKVTIATPQTRTVQYRESIILYANATNLPEGAKIKWSADNNCVTIKSSNDGKTCTVTSKSNGNVVITAYIVDANGDVITNEKCVRISDSEGITSEVTFWSMIIYAFRQMFSGNPFLSFIFKDLFN